MKSNNIIIITGLSGSGKSIALNVLEDEGYFCIDNMPVLLLLKFVELHSKMPSEVQKLAMCMDMREKAFGEKYDEVFRQLQEQGYGLRILFLEASESTLVKRYSQTRRKHPVSAGGRLQESIRFEKKSLQGIKKIAERVIDTSELSIHQLNKMVLQYANQGSGTEKMRIEILSFGYKYGLPLEADLLIDVRFIPNPYFHPDLKELDGKDVRVQNFVKKWDETREFLEKYFSLMDYLIPLYRKEGKAYLTIAVGCTGGRHRSVTIAEELFSHLNASHTETTLIHRDIDQT